MYRVTDRPFCVLQRPIYKYVSSPRAAIGQLQQVGPWQDMQPVLLEIQATNHPDIEYHINPHILHCGGWGEYVFSICIFIYKENCVYISERPSGNTHPNLLHQAHEQRDQACAWLFW